MNSRQRKRVTGSQFVNKRQRDQDMRDHLISKSHHLIIKKMHERIGNKDIEWANVTSIKYKKYGRKAKEVKSWVKQNDIEFKIGKW